MMSAKRGLIFVVVALFLLILPSLVSAERCLIYPEGGPSRYCVSYTPEMEQYCNNPNSGCDPLADVYSSNCGELEICQPVTCNTFENGCQANIAQGFCELQEGREIAEDEYDLWCTPGCCKLSNPPSGDEPFCGYAFNLNRYQCEQRAIDSGTQVNYFDSRSGMTPEQCNLEYCREEVLPASITGVVRSAPNAGISGAMIEVRNTDISATSNTGGSFSLTNVPAGTQVLDVSAAGFRSESIIVNLDPGMPREVTITLTRGEEGTTISGVARINAVPASGVLITWAGPGPTRGSFTTIADGRYTTSPLSVGQYTLTASKTNYQTVQRTITVGSSPMENFDFTLVSAVFQGIQGTTLVDGNPVSGVRIYIDGAFKGYSNSAGHYEITASPGNHILSARYERDYEFSASVVVPATGSGSLTKDILLTKPFGECLITPKDISGFQVHPVLGEKKVRLEWQKPCPEVVRYLIIRTDSESNSRQIQASLADTSWIDEVEWNQDYIYTIVAYYSSGISSPHPATAAIHTGDAECEGRYHDSRWESFCRVESPQIVFTCDNQNKVIPTAINCAERGPTYYCASISDTDAECKSISSCALSGTPFGLYSSRESCYDSSTPENGGAATFCTYDYTNTTIDQCSACTEVKNCFDYRSRDACQTNSCVTTKDCQWIDSASNAALVNYQSVFPGLDVPLFVTAETGSGYCVEDNYENDDKCGLCGPTSTSTLFENYFCTAEVCSGLGRCFSNPPHQGGPLSSCVQCGEVPSSSLSQTGCYAYNTYLECTGGQALVKDAGGRFTYSQDQCGWKRCAWWVGAQGIGQCVKDGDGNHINDCSSFGGAEQKSCMVDITPPRSRILTEGSYVISESNPTLLFEGSDRHPKPGQTNRMGVLGYCLTPADPLAPDQCLSTTRTNAFQEVPYSGVADTERVAVDLLESFNHQSNGETYRMKYYSKDKYRNQEELQETFVYIDNVAPKFVVGERVRTIADKTDLSIFLQGATEPLDCPFISLTQRVPAGSIQNKAISQNTPNKEVTFNQLPGIIYLLNVTCFDLSGNRAQVLRNYTFDLEENIDIIYPPPDGSIASTSAQFQVHTDVGATCSLHRTSTGERIDFVITDNEIGKEHRTPVVRGLTEGEYSNEFKVVCTEFHTNELFEDYFHFFIDRTPPSAFIVLREGRREERPLGREWDVSFIDSVAVDFECTAGRGFACDQTFYCLGTGCELINSPSYHQYSSTILLQNSTRICYYAQDVENRPAYPTCGTILIDGYGITLTNPPPRYYQGELWGVSSQSNFTLQFFTKVPTQHCVFDFTSGFAYEEAPAFRILTLAGDSRYEFSGFPSAAGTSVYPPRGGVKTIYLKCENADGEIGPEQKVNLEYDPTAPRITSASVVPNPLIEGNKASLLAETDDKTLCKYSDAGHTDYALMPYAFRGTPSATLGSVFDQLIMDTGHAAEYRLGRFIGLVRDINFTLQCVNGAGNLSQTESVILHVDYTQQGGIVSVYPNGDYLPATEVTFLVETSKNARCAYTSDNSSIEMGGAGGRTHTSTVSGLQEGAHQYPLACMVGDHRVEGLIKFTIDLTRPVIASVNDGTYSCGVNELNVMVFSNEANVSAYYYEVYRLAGQAVPNTATNRSGRANNTVFNSTLPSSPKTLVLNGSATPELPIRIPAASLQPGLRYAVRVKIVDKAGWVGEFAESDGVTITNASFVSCVNNSGAPLLREVINESLCNALTVELYCEDDQGCQEVKYGVTPSSSACLPTQRYSQKISVDTDSWLCYYVQDNTGKNYTGSKQLSYADEDGDSILDSCDVCDGTDAGEAADEEGCSRGQIPRSVLGNDSDGDGLSDYWEQQYGGLNCIFDYLSVDSDADGVNDPEEDYDQDSITNYEEFSAGTDPCYNADRPVFDNRTAPPRPPVSGGGKAIAWILLVVGTILILAGGGYLVYYYQYSGRHKEPAAKVVSPSPFWLPQGGKTPSATANPPLLEGIANSWKNIMRRAGRSRQEREQLRQRQEVFGRFGKDSEAIPHIADFLSKKAPHLPKLQELAKKYMDHKEEIKPGLRSDEKSIFTKLENIARKAQDTDIEEIVSPREARDIFSKLKDISDKRKGKRK